MARYIDIAKELDAEVVEVVKAAAHRQVLAPPIGIAFKSDAAPIIDLADPVGPAAQRCFEAPAAREIAVLPPVLWQYRQGGKVQGQRAAVVVLEVKAHLALALDDHVYDIGKLTAVAQAALGNQQVEGVPHVFGGYGGAIGKLGPRVEIETQPQALGVAFDALRDKAVHGVGLVQRPHCQG